jgi:hypothetical protein
MKLIDLVSMSVAERKKYKTWFNREDTKRYLGAAKEEIVALELDINSPQLDIASTRALGIYNGMHRVFKLFEELAVSDALSGDTKFVEEATKNSLVEMGYSEKDAIRIINETKGMSNE